MNTPPKYSVRDLPGDDWQVRYTKTIIRAIAGIKDSIGLTTEELAKRCNDFLGEKDAVKLSTLNGLFAGKRKSISVAEIMMFSSALGAPALSLMVPPWAHEIEVRPGGFLDPVRATRTVIGIEPWLLGPPNPLHMWFNPDLDVQGGAGHETEVIIMHWAAEDRLLEATGDLLNAIDRGADQLILNVLVRAMRIALRDYQHWNDALGRKALNPPALSDFMSWATALNPDQFTLEFAVEVAELRSQEEATMNWGPITDEDRARLEWKAPGGHDGPPTDAAE